MGNNDIIIFIFVLAIILLIFLLIHIVKKDRFTPLSFKNDPETKGKYPFYMQFPGKFKNREYMTKTNEADIVRNGNKFIDSAIIMQDNVNAMLTGDAYTWRGNTRDVYGYALDSNNGLDVFNSSKLRNMVGNDIYLKTSTKPIVSVREEIENKEKMDKNSVLNPDSPNNKYSVLNPDSPNNKYSVLNPNVQPTTCGGDNLQFYGIDGNYNPLEDWSRRYNYCDGMSQNEGSIKQWDIPSVTGVPLTWTLPFRGNFYTNRGDYFDYNLQQPEAYTKGMYQLTVPGHDPKVGSMDLEYANI